MFAAPPPGSMTSQPAWQTSAIIGLLVLSSVALSGWPAGLLTASAAFLVQRTATSQSGLWLLAGGLLWLLISLATGNRTLFFPFACWLASVVFVRNCPLGYWRGVVDSALVMGLFFAIRIQQGAQGRVLWMEIVAAVTVAGLAIVAEDLVSRRSSWRWIVAIWTSLLAGLSVIL